jgi:hypothetical protein
VVVHGPKSKEYYRDFVRPERVAGLPVAYHREDDTVYALPAQTLAHSIMPDELPQDDVRGHPDRLARYAAALDRPGLRMQWRDASAIDIDGAAAPGEVVSVQVNADPGWRATQNGHAIRIDADRLGFLVLHAAPSAAAHFELRYHGTMEQRLFAVICGLAWVAALVALFRKRARA